MPTLWPPGTTKKAQRDAARAAKHRELCFAVVKEALELWRGRYPIAERPLGFSVTPGFARACAALEKFDREDEAEAPMKILTPEDHQQICFALGAALGAISRFAAVRRDDDSGYIVCEFCLIAVARVRRGGQEASAADDDGTPLEHRAGCAAQKALDEIEKAMEVLR